MRVLNKVKKDLKSQPVPPGSILSKGVKNIYGNNSKSNSTHLVTPN